MSLARYPLSLTAPSRSLTLRRASLTSRIPVPGGTTSARARLLPLSLVAISVSLAVGFLSLEAALGHRVDAMVEARSSLS